MKRSNEPSRAHSPIPELLKKLTLLGFIILSLAGLGLHYLTENSPTTAQTARPKGPLLVRGYIATAIAERGGQQLVLTAAAPRTPLRNVYLPAVNVFLKDAGSGTETDSVKTDLSGRFTLKAPRISKYVVCWKADGYVPDCSKTVYGVTGPVHTSTIRILPDRRDRTTVVFGSVKLKDGSRPRAFEPMADVNAFARVELVDESDKLIQEVPVNNFGEYVLPRVPVQKTISINARIENGVKKQLLLPQANLAGAPFHPINLVIGNTPPRIDPLIPVDSNGRRVKSIAPGRSVELKAETSDADGDTLKYKWIIEPGSGILSATDTPNVTWKLPRSQGRYSVELLVSDGMGGYNKTQVSLRADERGIPFSGKVDATDAAFVAGARVEVNGQVASTGPDGTFNIFVRDASRFVLNIHKDGYGLVSRIYDDSVTGGRWTMTRATVMSFNPSQPIRIVDRRDKRNCPGPRAASLDWRGFPQLAQPQWQDGFGNIISPKEKLSVPHPAYFNSSASGSTFNPTFSSVSAASASQDRRCGPGMQIEIPADALRDARGRRATGNVDVAVSTVDLASPEQMPGDYTVRQPNGTTRVMQSYGAGGVEITGGGQRFNLRAGTTAKVTIPVDPTQLVTGAPIPPTIPILFYDERNGVWVEEGTATLQGTVYVAQVKHFSTINTDLVKTNQSCVEVDSPSLPASYKIEYTVPQSGGAAPVVRNATIDNSAPSIHVLYNLPSNTNIIIVPIREDTNVPIGTFVVNTGGPQNPTNPNLPALTAQGYVACSTKVVLTEQLVPEEPLSGEFLHGLYSFEAVDLDELDPVTAATYNQATVNYYAQVDPRGKRTTLNDFKTVNGFPTGEVNVKFANSGDLGFGRDMHCTKKANTDIGGFDVACYVTNYGNINTPDSDDVNATVAGTNPVATVAMEFSQVESANGVPDEFDDDERVVKFFVYNADGSQLLNAANLDGFGARPIPQLCMVCHNGEYPDGPVASGTPTFADREDVKLGSRFLPFDLHYYTFAGAPFDKATQQPNFKTINEDIVKRTHLDVTSISAAPDIKKIVEDMYTAAIQNENFVAAGWNATPLEQGMYKDVVARTCRTCHSANVFDGLTLNESQEMKNLLSSTEIRVCDDYVMPHARVTNQLFWLSVGPHMPAQLQVYGDTVAAATPGTGWTGQRCGEFTAGGSSPAAFYTTTIQPVFDNNHCTTCHSGGSPAGGLNLAAGVSYGNLFNVNPTASVSAGVKRVKPNDHLNSYLWRKLDGTQAAVGGGGSQMPQGFPPVSAATKNTIRDWIISGAPGP